MKSLRPLRGRSRLENTEFNAFVDNLIEHSEQLADAVERIPDSIFTGDYDWSAQINILLDFQRAYVALGRSLAELKTGFWKSIEYIESEESQLCEELTAITGKPLEFWKEKISSIHWKPGLEKEAQ